MTRRIIFSITAGLVVLGGLTFWYWTSPPQAMRRFSGPMEKISISAVEGTSSSLIAISRAKGYFQENGLDATLKYLPTGPMVLEQLKAGQIEVGHVSEFVLVGGIFEGAASLRCLGEVGATDIMNMVARKDRGILQPSDLKGKKIGVARGTAAEFFLGRFLTFNNLFLNDVKIIYLNPSEIPEALAHDRVDAAMVWDFLAYDIKKCLGDRIISWPGQSGQKFYNVVVSTDEFIKSRPEALERLFRALGQAATFIKGNREESCKIVARQIKVDPSIYHTDCFRSKFELSFDQALLLAMEDQARWMIKNNLTDQTRVPDYLDYIDAEPLAKVNPQAVSIIIPKNRK